ncbi:MAG: flavodoxin [Candidatus Scatosoma sp.]
MGVKIIGSAAFRKSTLSSINIPASVDTIGNYAFDDCQNLSEIAVSEENVAFASLDGVLYNKEFTELKTAPEGISGKISLPDTLIEIPTFAFDGRSNLAVIFIPDGGLIKIGNFAFRNTSLSIRYGGTEEKWNAIEKASAWGGDTLTVTFENQEDPSVNTDNQILVVYFSYSGNTQTIADILAEKTGATLVEIIPKIPYTAADVNYNDSSSRSQVERRNDARPEISDVTYSAIDMDKYQTILIGYPIWNGYEPMIIRTFIEYYNGLSGKTVYTFSTSASSGGGSAFNSVKGRCPTANVSDYLHFTRSELSNAETTAENKLSDWGLLKANDTTPSRMKMSFNGQMIFVTLADNSATRDLVSRLKAGALTIEFSDYGGSEKIGYPSPALDVSNANGCDPVVGNLTIYTPWGNLAAFYKDTAGYSDSLVLIGTIEGNGIEILAAQSGTFSVTIEIAL